MSDELDHKGEDSALAPRDEPAGESKALPAHLQLPSIDFSIPAGTDLATVPGPDTRSGAPISDVAPGQGLPAHLNLPSFPQFDLPPVPGEEDAPEPESQVGSAPSVPPPIVAETAVPPPMPPPRRVKSVTPPVATTTDLPELPGLPQIKTQPQPKRDPTLLNTRVDDSLKGSNRAVILTGIVLVLLVGGVAAAFLYRDTLVETVSGPEDTHDPDFQAKQLQLEAMKLWAEANALYQDKKLSAAVAKARESLEIDPKLGRAHKLLGVVFVAMKKNERAVKHYRRYLELAPDAPDAQDVRKIVSDYVAAKNKKTR